MVKELIILLFLLGVHGVHGQGYDVVQLNTNLRGPVYAATYFGENLVVNCHQKDRITKTIYDEANMEPSDLYRINTSDLSTANQFDEAFKTKFNDGPICFNTSNNFAILSQNLASNEKSINFENAGNHLGLFESTLSNEGWSAPLQLPFNNEDYINTHPAILELEGELILVFSSNRPNGFGGFDLWWSKKTVSGWSEPVNLGGEINTKGNEVFPTFVRHELYFSSDFNNTNLDIYHIPYFEKNKTIKKCLIPINSEFDDFSLISKDDGQSGYFSSNRNGEDAIFSFDFIFPDFNNCDEQIEDVFCYTLYEEYAAEIGEVPSLIYQWTINDVKLEGIEVDYCFPDVGDYMITLDIVDTIINEVYSNQASYELTLQLTKQPYITCPDTIALNSITNLSALESHLPGVENKEFYWKIDDEITFIGNEFDFSFSTLGNHQIMLGVIGGDDENPYKQCVTKSVYITDRLRSNELATTTPVIKEGDNAFVNDETYSYERASDSTLAIYAIEVYSSKEEIDTTSFEFRNLSKNCGYRLEYVESSDEFVLLVGEFGKIEDAHDTWKELIAQGYDEAVVTTYVIESYNNIKLNQEFVLEDVYFDVGSSDIIKGAHEGLDSIAATLERFPFLVVDIAAHTDSKGTSASNLKLSYARAKSVKNELIERGIDKDRINIEGLGETLPVATNETEEGRKKNRRVEFKLYVP